MCKHVQKDKETISQSCDFTKSSYLPLFKQAPPMRDCQAYCRVIPCIWIRQQIYVTVMRTKSVI